MQAPAPPLPLLILLAGCLGGEELPPRAFVAPLDGQTAVPLDMELVVHDGATEVPPDYPLPDTIRVVDLSGAGWVAGEVVIDAETVRFRPRGGWSEGHRYLWVFDPVGGVPHGPELDLPAELAGTAVFDVTARRLDVLAASRDGDRACLVFSRRLDAADTGDLRLTVNDVELEQVTWELLPEGEWSDWDLDPADGGVDVACLVTDEPVSAGAVLRAWWGDQGPWRAELTDEPIADTIAALRRASW